MTHPFAEEWYKAHLEHCWHHAFVTEAEEAKKEKREHNPHQWFKERITKNTWVIYWAEDYVWPHDGSVQGHVPDLGRKQFLLKEFYKSKNK